jgi:hypothetical protein
MKKLMLFLFRPADVSCAHVSRYPTFDIPHYSSCLVPVLPDNKLAVIDGLEGYLIAESDNVLLICKFVVGQHHDIVFAIIDEGFTF